MTLIEPPRVTARERAVAAVRAVRSHGRLVVDDADWPLYEAVLAEVGEGEVRVTFDDGLMELEVPSPRHEELSRAANRWVEVFLEEHGVEYRNVGSMTQRRPDLAGGLEADESYYIQGLAAVGTRAIDLSRDPPPDLAVEIDLSPPAVEKQSIYGRLGVPEIWRWRDDRLAIHRRQEDGGYVEVDASLVLPDFPAARLGEELARTPHDETLLATRAFRQWCGSARPRGERRLVGGVQLGTVGRCRRSTNSQPVRCGRTATPHRRRTRRR